ncbi:VPLPA-CTERM sorting domain-containing protein [uncultured Tateyamaria sp.]|uniref:VPLPA-CTERM sorting domain-containing protein n=1 Tax=uncultured Tateyamaria sp. TaxID=455651 RepID=UPI002638F807|nr:VPLPA-CTERM sorting domain-containing protein [uncultured Tateyamaria sp.]
MIFDLSNRLSACVFSVALAFVGSIASATTINFDVNEYYTSGTNTYTSTDGSVDVAVDGVRVNRFGTITNTENYWTSSWDGPGDNGGLGVYDCRWANSCLDNSQIDGAGPDEFALLDFGDLIVQITSITFSFWDNDDTFAYGVYENTAVPSTPVVYEDNLGGGANNPYTFAFGEGELVGSIIGFGVDSWNDNFRLQNITFDLVSAVPLPAGGLLILTGLGGLALMRRRRTITATATA